MRKRVAALRLNLEKYVLPETNARYLKITVNGNTQNDYASITEAKVSIQNTITTPPSPPSTGGGDTGDNSGAGDGVKMIYPTLTGGETWFFNPTNPNDGQFDRNGAEITKNSDGSWRLNRYIPECWHSLRVQDYHPMSLDQVYQLMTIQDWHKQDTFTNLRTGKIWK